MNSDCPPNGSKRILTKEPPLLSCKLLTRHVRVNLHDYLGVSFIFLSRLGDKTLCWDNPVSNYQMTQMFSSLNRQSLECITLPPHKSSAPTLIITHLS